MIISSDKPKKVTKTELAKSLGVSRQSLYYKPIREAKDLIVKAQIEAVMKEHKSYGQKRVAIELEMNKKKIGRIMKKYDLKPHRRRIWRPPKPDDLNKPPTVYKNEIKWFCPIVPNVVWAGDFTYIRFQGKFIYLATIMDIFTREIIGWNVSIRHDKYLVLGALNMALPNTKKLPLFSHNDQGSEYDSIDYIKRVEENNVTVSMSAKGHPWENGFQESFYSQFKVDLGWTEQFETLGELIEAIHLQINYYNKRRIHTSLRMSPVKFKEQYYLKSLALATPQA
ncbi:MAG: IS3 family transposase [Bacillota bacterium]